MRRSSGMRGQVFPAWVFGLLAVLALAIGLLQFGDRLSWQIRAQNAADAAAASMVAVQAQDINRMMILQTNLALEEVRIRYLADGAFFAARQTGYCKSLSIQCQGVFNAIIPKYDQAVHRYTTLALLYHQSTYKSTFANWKSDATNLLADLTSSPLCGTVSGLDCNFTYIVPPDGSGGIGGMALVDPKIVTFQISDGYASYANGGNLTPQASERNNPAYPVRAQVTVCRQVLPIIQSFFGIRAAPWTVIATGAAESFPVNDEWWKPGWMINSATGGYVRPPELVVSPPPGDLQETSGGLDDMYNPVFQGKVNTMPNSTARKLMEFDFSWWAALPLHPFLRSGTDYVAKC